MTTHRCKDGDPPSDDQTPRCGICFEYESELNSQNNDDNENEIIRFVHYVQPEQRLHIHWFCRKCLGLYLTQCENDRKVGPPVCPHPDCTTTKMDSELVHDILQRQYQPKTWYVANDNQPSSTPAPETPARKIAEEIDEEEKKTEDADTKPVVDDDNDVAFQTWIEENEHMKCRNCHAYIIRDDGCEAMQCLCGWRFCWDCKAPIRKARKAHDDGNSNNGKEEEQDDDDVCKCGHGITDFYDNIRRTEGSDTVPRLATLFDLQNMSSFYNHREDRDCDSYESSYDQEYLEIYAVDDLLDEKDG